jgi:hypothetical protein
MLIMVLDQYPRVVALRLVDYCEVSDSKLSVASIVLLRGFSFFG